jgi:hypothetical protein
MSFSVVNTSLVRFMNQKSLISAQTKEPYLLAYSDFYATNEENLTREYLPLELLCKTFFIKISFKSDTNVNQ